MSTFEAVYAPFGDHHAIADVSSAVAIRIPARACGIFIQALAENVRLVFGGGTATSSNGFQIKADEPAALIMLKGGTEVSIIEETASAKIQWQAVERWVP